MHNRRIQVWALAGYNCKIEYVFRSFVQVALQAVNGLGDVLWEVSFSTLGTQQMLTSWFQVSHMINSTSRDMIDGTDTEIYFG